MKVTKANPLGKINGITINETRLCNKGNYTAQSELDAKYIVMHYTGNKADSAINNATYYNREGNIGASAHLFVDSKEIWLSVPLNCKAWHIGNNTYIHPSCRNSNAIGIEMCTSGDYKIADKTIENAAHLCAELCKLIGITADKVDTYVLRHYDITHKVCPRQMSGENNAEWEAFKAKVKAVLAPPKPTKYTAIEMPSLTLGMKCPEVKTLRRLLRQLEYVGADGKLLTIKDVYDEETKAAVIRYQRNRGAKNPTGDVMEWTWNKLLRGI